MTKIYDMCGVGFGPSNMAIAIQAVEHAETGRPISMCFVERKASFSWHEGMLLDNADMQISIFKDLATLRNPRSHFTFLNYSKHKGRLAALANLKQLFPSRLEFNDYLSWVAAHFDDQVAYGETVVEITPYDSAPCTVLQLTVENTGSGVRRTILTRNLIVATGGEAKLPACVAMDSAGASIFHAARFLEKIAPFLARPLEPYHFVVVGGGQSAAEIVEFLYLKCPNARVTCVHQDFGFKPADDSEFINELFDADNVDFFYQLHADDRKRLLTRHADTNYSVVDIDLIKRLYKIRYDQSVVGPERMVIRNLSTVIGAAPGERGIDVSVRNNITGSVSVLEADAAIFSTGYSRTAYQRLLAPLQGLFETDTQGNPVVDRSYRVRGNDGLRAGIYLQGTSEATHGLSDTLLSVLAFRGNEIFMHLLAGLDHATAPDLTAMPTP